jgi:hypothetical protein
LLSPDPRWSSIPAPAVQPARVEEAEAEAIDAAFLKAYRWQYIHSGAQHPQFGKVLSSIDQPCELGGSNGSPIRRNICWRR